MSENTYSLEKLAWLSRCLFPKDFYNELMEMGVEQHNAIALSGYIRTSGEEKRDRNILELYQVCISCDEYTKIIDDYCTWWFDKK